MFTGIVQSKAEIISVEIDQSLMKLVLQVDAQFVDKLELGASIAVNGVCLTVVHFEIHQSKALITFDVIDETLKVTNLGQLKQGGFVNVERSLKMGDELGGHIVSGHIHTTALLIERKQTPTNCQLLFSVQGNWLKYILAKGFITINGISLTVGEVAESSFYVHLIPETLARTNLADLPQQGVVNIECDQQTMTIVNTIERMKLS